MVRRQGRNNPPAARERLGWAGALVLSAAASAAGASATSRPTSSPVTFSVATYNIHGANRHLPQVVANIRRTKADLVCLQEVNRGASPTLKKHLRGQYPHMVFGLNQVVDGFALLARKPITHRGWVPAGRINYHSVLHARTELGGREVQVVAVHLIPNIPKPRAAVAEQWKHFARQERIRNRDVARVAGLFSKELPVLALGDFNCLSFQGAVMYMASRGFVDSAASVCERPDALYTWRGRFSGRLLHTRIDYIFHTTHFRTLASRVIHQPGSDHFPVVSTLAWAKRRAAGAPEGERGGAGQGDGAATAFSWTPCCTSARGRGRMIAVGYILSFWFAVLPLWIAFGSSSRDTTARPLGVPDMMNIYVGNLPYNMGDAELEAAFAAYGAVDRAKVIADRETGRSRGFGFVEMPNDDEARAAMEALNGNEIDGRRLTVNEARPRH